MAPAWTGGLYGSWRVSSPNQGTTSNFGDGEYTSPCCGDWVLNSPLFCGDSARPPPVLESKCLSSHTWSWDVLELVDNRCIMEMGWVLQIHFQNVAGGAITWHLLHLEVSHILHPFKTTDRDWLRHRPPIKIIRVKLNNVGEGQHWIVFIKVALVGLSIPMSGQGNTPAQSLLNEQILIDICQGVELDVG